MRKLNASHLGRVLVMHDDQLVGIISQSDIARWLERARLREQVADGGTGRTPTHG